MAEQPTWRSLYPFESRWHRLDEGYRCHYLDEGDETRADADRPTLLLVHGNPTWSFYWRHLVSAWRDRYRVVVPDHLGCGLSDKPVAYDYCLQSHIDNLLGLIDGLDLREITLVAHDWGGTIGMGAAAAAPRRFRRFVLMNTAAFRSSRMPWRIRVCRTPWLGPIVVGRCNGFLRAALTMATAKPERFTPEVRAGYLAPYARAADRIAIRRFVEDIPRSPRHRSYAMLAAIEAALPSFRDHPVQLIWGMKDWCFTPHFLDRWIEFFPQAEVHRLADAGHWVAEDAHERIAEIVGNAV